MTRLYGERDLPPDAWDAPDKEEREDAMSQQPKWADMFGVWPDHPGTDDDQAARALADMTRQRDEAVKAFQRERARVGRVETLAGALEQDAKVSEETYRRANRARMADKPEVGLNHLGASGAYERAATAIRAALADRPTDD